MSGASLKLQGGGQSGAFTSSTFAVEAHGESEVSGELDLLGVHGDSQTTDWTQRWGDPLPVDLQQEEYELLYKEMHI